MPSTEECLHFDVQLDPSDYEDNLHKLLAMIRPKWNKEDIKMERMALGIINVMVVCYVRDKIDDNAIVVRMYNKVFDEVVSRTVETACARCCGELDIGPELVGIFRNGYCAKFYVGTTYTWYDVETFKDVGFARAVAKSMAGLHCNKTLERFKSYETEAGMNLIKSSYKQLEGWPVQIENTEIHDRFYTGLQTKEELLSLLRKFDRMVEGFDVRPVLSHGDPNPTNFMFNQDPGRVVFVDFEMAGVRIPMDDLARYFQFSSLGLTKGDIEKHSHSPEYVREFIKTYLEELRTLNRDEGDVTEEEVDRYCRLVEKYSLVIHLVLAIHTPHFINTVSEDRFEMGGWADTCKERLDYTFRNAGRIMAK